ncbi:MAG: flavodoxin family protein [Pseudomonadota bacterium]
MSIKIIGVSASPRKGKSTRFMLDKCLEAARDHSDRITTEVVDLAEVKVGGCLSCEHCRKKLKCSQKDGFNGLIPILSAPDLAGLILATPVYLGSMSSQAKAFLDRCVLFRRNGFMFRNKVAGVLAVGGFRNGGQEIAIGGVHAAMLIQDMIVVGDGSNTSHFGGIMWSGHPEGYRQDALGLETAINLGRRVSFPDCNITINSKKVPPG